jgi:hypothetical protein
MLRARISSLRSCSVHTSVLYALALGIQNEHFKNRKTDAHAEHVRKELMRMVIKVPKTAKILKNRSCH